MACLSGGESRRWTIAELVERFKNLGVCASRASVTAALAELALELELSGSRALAPARTRNRMDPGAQIRALRASFRRQAAPIKRGKDAFRGTQGRTPGRLRSSPKRGCLQNQGGGDTGARGLFYLDDLLSFGLIYCDPSRELNFWRPTPSALLRSGFAVPHRHSRRSKSSKSGSRRRKRCQTIAKLDPFFERTSKLASRRLKREIERRGTLGEFALEPNILHLKRIPPKESGSDLLRSNESDAVELSARVESPQSVVQGCPAQGSAVGPGEKES